MKAKKMSTLTKTIFIGILATLMIFSLDSCTRKVAFLTSSVVPAARGSVKVKKDNNHNYVIKIELTNLAEVKRLQPPKQAYVVWMVTSEEATKNIGQINSSSSMLSSKLKASFETVSSIKPIKIFITAEDDATIQYPGVQILSTDSFN